MKRIRCTLRLAAWLGFVLALNVETGAAQDLAGNLDHDVERELTAEVSAKGIDGISLDGHDGKAVIEVGGDDQIQIRVTIKAKRKGLVYTSSAGRAYVESARLETDAQRGMLEIAISGGKGRDDTEETWTIVVPRHLAVEVEMSAARIDITDVTGGVAVNLGVGKALVDVPRGNIAVKVGVGTANVTTATDSFGDVDLRAQVGDTGLWISGHRFKYPDPPGPGSKISMEGEGRDQIKVSVQVGDGFLRIG